MSGLTCFMASSYVGGGRSQRLLNVVPRKEKNRDEERKEPVGDVKPGPLPLIKIITRMASIPKD